MVNKVDRYNFIQEKSGLNKKDFAETLGLSKSMGSQISTGRTPIPDAVLDKLARVHKVNLHWFLTGEGKTGLDADTVEIEVLDQEAAAGAGREVEDYAERTTLQVPRSLVAPYRPEKLQGVYVAGDSMTGDNLASGDLAIFYPDQYRPECIHVVSVDNSLLVKRVIYNERKKTLDLISSNPAYPVRHFSGRELEHIRIAGQVIAVWKRM